MPIMQDDVSPQSSSEGPKHMRSLTEIYAETEEPQDSTLFCLFVDSEPVIFEEALQDRKWKMAMEEEMNAIKKNDT